MSFTEFMKKGRRWLLYAFACAAIGIVFILFGRGAAHADPIPEQPQPSVPFTFPTLTWPLPPTPETLQQQADILATQAQAAFNDTIQNAQKEALTTVNNLTQPAPAAIPAVAPVAPPVISPEIDNALTDILPASLPEITQRIIDPVYETGISAVFGVPVKMPEPERMDKNTPLSTQVEAVIDLFKVKDVVPDMTACGGESLEAKTSCATAIIADSVPNGEPIARVNLVSRYGVEAWPTQWGSICGGYISSAAYCGEVYVSKYMLSYLAADPSNPAQSEITLVLAHENQHSRDAIAFKRQPTGVFEYGPGVFNSGPGAFFAHVKEDTANEFLYEQRADSGGMTIVRSAVDKGQLSPEAIDQSYALLGRIGHTMPDGSREPTHGTSDDRIAAGEIDIDKFDGTYVPLPDKEDIDAEYAELLEAEQLVTA